MKTQLRKPKTMLMILLLITFSTYGQDATFEIISLTPEPAMLSFAEAAGLSSDGTVVVGFSDSDEGSQAFRWENGEIQGLGFFPDGNYSHATAVSYDGTVVIGTANYPSGTGEFTSEAFRWVVGTEVLEGIGYLPNSLGYGYCEPRGTSADGSVIVGTSLSDLGSEAFRWEDDEMMGLGDFEGGDFLSFAYNTTADGSVIVGYGTKEDGTAAFRWEDGVMEDIGSLGEGDSYAHNITPDGSIIVGKSNNQAFRWENGEMEGLELLPEWIETSASGVSADGSIIVGFAFDGDFNMEPFIWTENHGMRKLIEILEVDYNIDFGEYALQNATKVIHNGETIIIVGWGFGPNITGVAWRATIPLNPLSSQDFTTIKEVITYPNPTTGIVNFKTPGTIEGIKIFDMTGKHVKTPFSLNNKTIDISSVSKGVYFIELTFDGQKQTHKIIKK